MEDGAFDNTDSRKCAPLRSLSAAKKDSYPLEGNALSFAGGYGEFYAQFFSQRSDWMLFQTRATCAVGAMGAKL